MKVVRITVHDRTITITVINLIIMTMGNIMFYGVNFNGIAGRAIISLAPCSGMIFTLEINNSCVLE